MNEPWRPELQAGDPRRIGPYFLMGRLGTGGMGRVYIGRSPGGRIVAVKVIREELASDPEFRARFSHPRRADRAATRPAPGRRPSAPRLAGRRQQPLDRGDHRRPAVLGGVQPRYDQKGAVG
jgi:hypothetical protein